MVKAGTPQPILDTLNTAIQTMKKSEEWQNFSRLNMQSSVDVSPDGMQKQVRQEVHEDSEFLRAIGLAK
jgi:tripartite-type tricarboxylate transporter receptor subunit TctC